MQTSKILKFMGWPEGSPMTNAVADVISGRLSQRRAAIFHDVPQSALSRRLTALRAALNRVTDLTGITFNLPIKDGRK